ncbi:DUF1868 domain-containing protein, partial [Rhizobium johnstonii]|uniref:DUF1868 domain-containing protein n=1 Tax=Rhizobium johnstonii TaxID=3019933 RepID=UPI003F9B86C9
MERTEAQQGSGTTRARRHRTRFEGVSETRRRQDCGSGDLPLDAPSDDIRALRAARLEGFAMAEPFKVAIVEA